MILRTPRGDDRHSLDGLMAEGSGTRRRRMNHHDIKYARPEWHGGNWIKSVCEMNQIPLPAVEQVGAVDYWCNYAWKIAFSSWLIRRMKWLYGQWKFWNGRPKWSKESVIMGNCINRMNEWRAGKLIGKQLKCHFVWRHPRTSKGTKAVKLLLWGINLH